MNVPYLPGDAPPPDLPLGRFLPALPAGMVKRWCLDNLEHGQWVIDPFGFSPLLAIEAASAGFPVLVTVNNPIHAFILEILASAPQENELVASLQDLGTSTRGDDRMEAFVRSLYQVDCAVCRRNIEADAFLWKKGADYPYASLIECSHCGARGEQTMDDAIRSSLSELPPLKLHQARAINRIAEPNDPLRSQVENALSAYPARPLIVLQTMLNKMESLDQTKRRRDLLIALILTAADQGNTLWTHPTPRERPRQIVIPSVYREKNLWKAMEEAVSTWQLIPSEIPLHLWGRNESDEAGIYIFRGRFKQLEPKLDKGSIAAVVTSIPRPNQAFWTLSALWTGWIWGREAMAPIRSVLARQRYDWNWHANALMGVFESLTEIDHPRLKFWGLIPEYEPMLLLSSLLAANAAGWELSGFALSLDDQLAQTSWNRPSNPIPYTQPGEAKETAIKNIKRFLNTKGEPARYDRVHTAAITGLAADNQLAIDIFMQNQNQAVSETQKWIENLFKAEGFLRQFGEDSTTIESGYWYLTDLSQTEQPLADRVEEKLLQHLLDHQRIHIGDIRKIIHESFPGIYTPDNALLANCLESYAEPVDPDRQDWQLKPSDQPAAREKDLQEIHESLRKIGLQLDYRVSGDSPMQWKAESESQPEYHLYTVTSAAIPHLEQPFHPPANKTIIVLPGSRANLLAYKKQRDPFLRRTLEQNVVIVKYRLVRDLAANPLLNRKLFEEQVNSDPPEYRSTQLALF